MPIRTVLHYTVIVHYTYDVMTYDNILYKIMKSQYILCAFTQCL
jgi:hypothetical protein